MVLKRIKQNRTLRKILLPSIDKYRTSRFMREAERRNVAETLHIEPTPACNLKCKMCFRNKAHFHKQHMEFELYKHLAGQAADSGVKKLLLYFRGEPLLHPRIVDMVVYAKEIGFSHVEMNTNAQLLTREMSSCLIQAGLDKIFFSIEGYEKETYENIRRGASFEKLLENIHHFNEERTRNTDSSIRSGLISVNMKGNRLPDKKFNSFWEIHFDEILTVEMINHEGIDNPEMKIDRSKPQISKSCLMLWNRMAIMADGKVPLCCIDINNNYQIGDAANQSLTEIWKGPEMSRYRSFHRAGMRNRIPICSTCTYME